jgi:hypothetical protein
MTSPQPPGYPRGDELLCDSQLHDRAERGTRGARLILSAGGALVSRH